MNWDAVGAIAEVIGVVAVIATVVYLSIQIKQSNRQQSAQAVKEAVKEFVDAYAAVTADEKSAQNFREGLSRFGDLDRNAKAVFHCKNAAAHERLLSGLDSLQRRAAIR